MAPPSERSARALLSDAARFAEEDPARTRRLLATTVLALLAAGACAASRLPLPLRLLGSVLEGLVMVRLFIFLHDIEHGSIFRGSRVGPFVSRAIGCATLVSPSVWRELHDAHHASTGLLLDAERANEWGADRINRVVDVETWATLPTEHRRAYAFSRHVLVIVFAWLTVFAIGIGLSAFATSPRKNASALVVVLVHFGVLALAWSLAGGETALLALALPSCVASALGAYLFYAQHSSPGVAYQHRGERWDPVHAALHGSTFFRMSKVAHWFTGNIGFHHVHHLNPKIPFYRLPEAMEAIPELHDPPSTSFALRDVAACFSSHVWEPRTERLVDFDEAGTHASV